MIFCEGRTIFSQREAQKYEKRQHEFPLASIDESLIFKQQIMIIHVLPPERVQKLVAPQSHSWLWVFFLEM